MLLFWEYLNETPRWKTSWNWFRQKPNRFGIKYEFRFLFSISHEIANVVKLKKVKVESSFSRWYYQTMGYYGYPILLRMRAKMVQFDELSRKLNSISRIVEHASIYQMTSFLTDKKIWPRTEFRLSSRTRCEAEEVRITLSFLASFINDQT